VHLSPAGQGKQTDQPAFEKNPSAHGYALLVVVLVQKLIAGHILHDDSPPSLYVPGAQAIGASV
jgi:hypothetical protein